MQHRLDRCWRDLLYENKLHQTLQLNVLEKDYVSIARNIFLNKQFFDILEAFLKLGIPVIPLKGIALIQNVYTDIAERYVGDIDLLVKPGDVFKSAEILRGLGYSSARPYFNPPRPSSIYLNSQVFNKPTEINYFIHLHWHLLNTTLPLFMYRINMDDVFNQARIEKIQDGRRILMLEPHHLLVYLCLHAFCHSFDRLSLLCDIKKVIEFYKDELNWDRVIRLAGKWNAGLPLYLSLYFVRHILNAPLPEEVLCALKPKRSYWALKRIIPYILKNRRGEFYFIYILSLETAGGFLDKIKFIFLSLFPAPSVFPQIYAPGFHGSFLRYYLMRIKNLIKIGMRERLP